MARGSKRGSVWLYGRAKLVDPGVRRAYLLGIGGRVRDLRLARGVSVAELSAGSGVSPAAIYSIEAGTKGSRDGAHVWTLCRIALALDASPSELLP